MSGGTTQMRPSEAWRERVLVPRLTAGRALAAQINAQRLERMRAKAERRRQEHEVVRLHEEARTPHAPRAAPSSSSPAPKVGRWKAWRLRGKPKKHAGAWLHKAGGRHPSPRTPNPDVGKEQYRHQLSLQTSERRRRNKVARAMRARQRRMRAS